MKNLFGALTAGMLVCSSLVASPVGNAAAPMSFQDGVYLPGNPDYSLRVGFSADHISDRHMRIDESSDKSHLEAAIMSHTADVTLSMYNRFDLFGRFGVANFVARQNHTTSDFELRTARDSFIWALGGRVVIYNWDFTTLSAFGEYSHFKADVTDVILGSISSGYTSSRATVRDWNVGIALSHEIDYAAPYIAVKYSDAHVNFTNSTISSPSYGLKKMASRNHVGAVVGCTFMAGKKLDLSVEGRLFDETAMALVGAVRF